MRWFKHDSDASNDSRIRKLKAKFGMEGYGVFFNTLELIARKMEDDVERFGFLPDEWDDEALELEFGKTTNSIRTMYEYMCQIGLFEIRDGKLFNGKIQRRCDDYTARLLRKDGFVQNSGTNSEQSTNSVRTKSDKVPLDKNRIDKNINIIDNIGETPVKEENVKYGNLDVNTLVDYLKEKMELPDLDGGAANNRKYAWILLKKSKKGIDGVKWLIDQAASDKWFRTHVTSFRDLWANYVKIISTQRGGMVYVEN